MRRERSEEVLLGCKNNELKLNWKSGNWKQRFKCKNCNHCFVKKYKQNDKVRWTRFFDNWLKEWYSIRQLSNKYWKNEEIIRENIKNILDDNLIYQIDLVFYNVEY